MSRALKRRTDPAPLSPPPSDWCRSRTGSRALFGLLQPLDHLGGDVKARVDGQEDAAVLTVHIEDQRVVGFGADALDDPDDPGLDRLEQLLLPLLVAGLHVVLALLQALLHGLQVALLRLFARRGERQRLLLEGFHRGVPLRLHPLQRVTDALALFAQRRFGGGVARCLLEDRLRVDEGDFERALRLRAEHGRCGRDQPDPRPHCHHTPHSRLPERKTGVRCPALREESDQKKLPSLKCSLNPGAGRPKVSVRSKPYAQSIPMGPRGEMMLKPRPAPWNRRVGSNSLACAHTFPASTNMLM